MSEDYVHTGHRLDREPPAETWKAESRRRLGALEAHITDLESRLNARGIFSGHVYSSGPDARPCTDSCCPGFGKVGQCAPHEHAEYDFHGRVSARNVGY